MIQNFHGKFLPGSIEGLQVRFADSEAQKMYKDVLKFYNKSMVCSFKSITPFILTSKNMFSLGQQGFYNYAINSQQSTCSSPDSTLVDDGMEDMLEELSEFDLNK